MDEGLFAKHLRALRTHDKEKESIIVHIKNTTGITLESGDFTLTKKIISFSVSSTKKAALIKRGIDAALLEKGYTRS